jgi:dipeptidyl aminopeptidase/acylaminoacyl peptidase
LRRIVLGALLAFACSEKLPGRRLASGIAQQLTVQGASVAFLMGAAHPDDRAVPQDLYAGDLWAGPLDGEARKVGAGVSSQPGAFAFSPDGSQIAYLAAWRFRAGAGELWVARIAGGAPEQLAAEARSFAWSPSGELSWVAPDKLGVRGAQPLTLAGLSNLEWSPDGKRIAARASGASGGKLWLVENGAAREIASGTSDFAFASDGTLAALGPPPGKGGDRPLLVFDKGGGAPREVAHATAFQFSPDGKEIALLSTAREPGEAIGDLYKVSRSSGAPVLVASKVNDWRWAFNAPPSGLRPSPGDPAPPVGDLLCLSRYDLRARAGTLTVSSGDKTREIASKVQSFTAFGRRVLYLVQAPQKGDFKIELWGVDLATGAAPRKIDEGVYGWDLAGDTLLYKARCAGGPRSCSLLRVPFSGSDLPALVAADVAGFDLSRDGQRVLAEQPHPGAPRAVDLVAVPITNVQTERLKPLVEEVDPSARFADPAGKRVVFATLASGKQGVYVAEAAAQ